MFALNWTIRRPPTTVPMPASSQAAIGPSPSTIRGHWRNCASAAVTVSATGFPVAEGDGRSVLADVETTKLPASATAAVAVVTIVHAELRFRCRYRCLMEPFRFMVQSCVGAASAATP